MKKFITLMVLAVLPLFAGAQRGAVYTKPCTDRKLAGTAAAWVESGAWKNGFTKAVPDASVNIAEFYTQYQRNPETWRALFAWLERTDLLAIPGGRHVIPGTTLIASVEDSYNEPLAKRKSESHHWNADFMFVVRGTEGFRRLDHNTSRQTTKYKYDVVRYDFVPERCETLTSTPGRFIIMFPDDWHIAKVTTDEADQNLRVIVVKMPYLH